MDAADDESDRCEEAGCDGRGQKSGGWSLDRERWRCGMSREDNLRAGQLESEKRRNKKQLQDPGSKPNPGHPQPNLSFKQKLGPPAWDGEDRCTQ